MTTVDALFRAQLDSMRREVGRLRALKQGLMDDVLTGRVRVTGHGWGTWGLDEMALGPEYTQVEGR